MTIPTNTLKYVLRIILAFALLTRRQKMKNVLLEVNVRDSYEDLDKDFSVNECVQLLRVFDYTILMSFLLNTRIISAHFEFSTIFDDFK